MLKLYSLTLACLLGFAKNTALFSEKCCSKKNVGGVDYTQIPGDTTDFPDCKADCVYEQDDTPGSRFCFSTGDSTTDKPAMCTESTSTTQKVSVTLSNGKLEFPIDPSAGSLTCNIDPLPNGSEDEFKETKCTPASGTQGQTTETATLIQSFSSKGVLEWISLHAEPGWIHCTYPELKCSICTTCIGEANIIYVEGAQPTDQSKSKDEQLTECKERCENASCKFWTFSYFEQPGHDSRKHDDKSECGLRNYDPCCLIETERDQWFGIVVPIDGLPPPPYQKNTTAAVWKSSKGLSNKECQETCKAASDCTTWTWEKTQQICSLNNYKPVRRIDTSFASPTGSQPTLYSGCIDRGLLNCSSIPLVGRPPSPTPLPTPTPTV